MSFDSGKEAADAQKFMLAVRAGEYIAYLHHVRFPLRAGIVYEADHVLITLKAEVEVYDTKTEGTKTQSYRMKRKLFRERYGMEIREI
jgi:hypothetical protein